MERMIIMGKKKDVRIGYGFDLSGLLKEVQAIDRKQGSKLKSLKKTKVFDPENCGQPSQYCK